MKLIWNQATTSHNTSLRIQGYLFTFDKELKPIPVEVPSHIAKVLLQMSGREHGCCPHTDVEPLFLEVR